MFQIFYLPASPFSPFITVCFKNLLEIGASLEFLV